MIPRLAAVLLLLSAPPWAAAAPLSSETNTLVPFSEAGGEPMGSTNYRATASGPEAAAAPQAAGTTQSVAPGLMHVIARPGTVTELGDRGDVTLSSVTLQWTAPGADGERGALQSGSRYHVRIASYTSPDTFAFDGAETLTLSTSGVVPGQRVQEGITGLLLNTTYYVQLWTRDPAGNLSYSSPRSTITTLAPAPPQHELGPFLQVNATSVTARWHPQPLASGYTLFASSKNFAAGEVVESSTTWNTAVTTLTVTGLNAGATYFFRVGSLNWIGLSSFTVLGSTKTRLELFDPLTVASTYTAISSYSVTLDWDRNGAPAGTIFTLETSTAADFSGTADFSSQTYTSLFNLFHLLNNTTYHFRVQAASEALTSNWLVFLPTSTFASPPTESPPSIRDLRDTQVTFSWALSGNIMSRTTYTVVATTVPFYPNSATGNVYLSTIPFNGQPTATIGGLATNTTYHFFVAALNHNSVLTDWLQLASTSTLASQPAAAAQPFVEISSVSAHVFFDGAANAVEVTTYTLTLTPEDPFPNTNPFNVTIATREAQFPLSHSAIFNGLQPNTTYWYHAAGVNHNSSLSDYRNYGATVTHAVPPSAAAVSQVFPSSLTVTWASQSAQGFRLRASSTSFAAGTVVVQSSTTNDSATTLFAAGLEPNTTQFLRLAAYNWNNHPTEVVVEERATLALQPSNTAFYQVGSTHVTVNWRPFPAGPSSATALGYVLEASTSPDFSPVEFSSISIGVGLSTLTINDLQPGSLYWFRVGSLNWNSLPHYQGAGSATTLITPVNWDGGGGNDLWHTASNWNPNGVPTAGSPVTIASNISVFVPATAAAIQFSSLTIGSPDGSVSASLILSTTVRSGRDVLIHRNSGLVQGSTSQLYFDGDFTMMSGSSLTHVTFGTSVSSVNIRISGTFEVQAGASIAVSSVGWAGGAGNGGGGLGPGGGFGDSSSNAGGTGAGHGGAGGDSNGGASPAPGIAYGDSLFPIFAGAAGGRGGGVAVIEAETFILNGIIHASGLKGDPNSGGTNVASGGGGSGGTINIKTAVLQGGGTVQAYGGAGGDDTAGGDDPGGGGAGGRVVFDVTGSGFVCDLNISVTGGAAGTGGTTATAGGNGTVSSTMTLPVPSFTPVSSTSNTIHWVWSQESGISTHRLYAQGGSPISGLLGPNVTFYTETGLLPNTTYTRYVQVAACGSSSDTASAAFATLASTVTSLARAFPTVDETFLGVAWAALPDAPAAATSEGYRLEVSSRSDFQGLTHSSETANVAASTLAVSGLLRDTTYFARVASLNHVGSLSPWVSLGSTSTLTMPPTFPGEPFAAVGYSSASISWDPQAAHGFVVQASTTNFGALSPGGALFSSMTFNGLSTTLLVSVPALELCTPHYFRVGALNWNGSANFAAAGSTTAAIDYGVIVSTRDLDIGSLDVDTEVAISTSFALLSNPGCPVTYSIRASTLTVGSPWVIAASSGTDAFTLQALFNDVQPADTDYEEADKLLDGWQVSDSGRFAGGQTGVSVPYQGQRLLWLRLGLPRITSTSDPQQIRVQIRADPP